MLALTACGGSDDSKPRATTPAPPRRDENRPATTHALTLGQARKIPLGTTLPKVLERFGEPASGRRFKRASGGRRCVFYNVVGQPPRIQWQLCFKRSRLNTVSTFIR